MGKAQLFCFCIYFQLCSQAVWIWPGKTGIFTLKAHSCLGNADIIFHDTLLDSNYLQKFTAAKVPVGKRYGRPGKKINFRGLGT